MLRRRLRRERASSRALRIALEARIWEDHVREIDKLDPVMRELRRHGHDVNNALSAALLSSQLFFDTTHSDSPSPGARADLAAAAEEMVDALRRLKTLIESERRAETTVAPSSALIRPVELVAAVRERAARARARHPRAELFVRDPEPDARELYVSVCGGRLGFSRALDALLENACGADGVRAPVRVRIEFGARREVDVVALEVSDDGPAFTPAELAAPISAFGTTRTGTLGLGLYTAERIARASGGSLRRESSESGGAVVSLFLPIATGPAASQ